MHVKMYYIQVYAYGMCDENMAKNMAIQAYQMVQHKYGPIDKELFLHMFPEFMPLFD
jgi:hypothetical protein